MTMRFLLAAACAALTLVQPALADGKSDWADYAWQTIKVSECLPAGGQLACPPYHQKWDWKRNQWVDIGIAIDVADETLSLVQQLTDNDSYDDDYVCVTALVVDAEGNNLVAHHTNWHMLHGEVVRDDFVYRSEQLAKAATIYIGSKQCRKGGSQDDALYAAVLAGIAD